MQFFVPNKVSIDVELSSGKIDSFEELSNLLNKKEQLSNEIANEFAIQLGINAEKKLNTTQDRYIDAISVSNGVVNLDTSDFVVHLVEDGNKSFDMKKRLQTSPKVKIAKNGQKYLTIPIKNDGKVDFRIMSESSPADSWIHPGHKGFKFIDLTMDTIDEQIEHLIDDKINAIINKL